MHNVQRLRLDGCCSCWLLLPSRRQRRSGINPPLKICCDRGGPEGNYSSLSISPFSSWPFSPPSNPDLHSMHAHPVWVPAWHSGCLWGWGVSRSTKAAVSCLIVTVTRKNCTDTVCWEELWWEMCVMTTCCCRVKDFYSRLKVHFFSLDMLLSCTRDWIDDISYKQSILYSLLFEDPRIT